MRFLIHGTLHEAAIKALEKHGHAGHSPDQ